MVGEHGVDLAYLTVRSQLCDSVGDFSGRVPVYATPLLYLLFHLIDFVQLHQLAVLS